MKMNIFFEFLQIYNTFLMCIKWQQNSEKIVKNAVSTIGE
jgi:hypothetical protein